MKSQAAAEATTTCRNCGAAVSGEYCATCGQETRIKLPTARVFLREATGRYVALDGRMWRTLAALLFRPGFLTREYLRGRRRRYIRPARLFLVLSLALFAAIRIFASAPILVDDDSPAKAATKPSAKADPKSAANGEAKSAVTGESKSSAKPAGGAVVKFDESEEGGDLFSVPGFKIHVDRDLKLDVSGEEVPWFSNELQKRFQHFNGLNRQEKSEQVFLGVVRYGPYAMFVLMPLFALLQMVAYAGRGRRYPDRPNRYAEHIVFAAHTHAFLFLVGVLALAIPSTTVRIALAVWWVLYGLWATKAVYRGGWLGLLTRATLVAWAYAIAFGLVIAGLVMAAILLR
jgi:Protein of unknown function (DUF3667)